MLENFKKIHPIRYKYLFTVTTFSKYLALSMFIIFPFIGFYLGMIYQAKIISYNLSSTSPNLEKPFLLFAGNNPKDYTPTPTYPIQIMTYKNNKFGFYFEYSSDYLINEESQLIGTNGGQLLNVVENNHTVTLNPTIVAKLSYYENPDNISILDFDNKYLRHCEPHNCEFGLIVPGMVNIQSTNGIKAYLYKQGKSQIPYTYVFQHGKYIYKLDFGIEYANNDNAKRLFENIFNTFQFTN